MRFMIMVALVATAASTLWAYPHELAYFNELAGGAENGHQHLLGSSLDWGQDILPLIEWQRAQPSETVAFYWLRCSYDPRALGLCGIDLHGPNWRDTILAHSDGHEVTIMLSRQAMVEQVHHLSMLTIEPTRAIGPSILVCRAKCVDSGGDSRLGRTASPTDRGEPSGDSHSDHVPR